LELHCPNLLFPFEDWPATFEGFALIFASCDESFEGFDKLLAGYASAFAGFPETFEDRAPALAGCDVTFELYAKLLASFDEPFKGFVKTFEGNGAVLALMCLKMGSNVLKQDTIGGSAMPVPSGQAVWGGRTGGAHAPARVVASAPAGNIGRVEGGSTGASNPTAGGGCAPHC